MLENLFEVELKGSKLVAKNLATKNYAPDGTIRYQRLKEAYSQNLNIFVSPVNGRISLVSKDGDPNSQAIIKPTEPKKALYSEIVENRDPEVMFENLRNITRMVGKGLQPSAVVTGMAGMGKTHIVKETLEEIGLRESYEFVHFKGRATAAGLYLTLYEYSDKLVILDDCDSVFKDDDAVNILKAALDSYDIRRISYISSRELKMPDGTMAPKTFEFTGQVIFISNIPQSKIDDAIKSRSFVQDISMTTNQIFMRMEQLLTKIEPNVRMENKREALDLMKELYDEYEGVSVNLRSLIKAIRIANMGFTNTKAMIAEQVITIN